MNDPWSVDKCLIAPYGGYEEDDMETYQQLEVEFARWNGLPAEGMVACSSGTAALHLALEAMRLPPGSEVLVPDFTMVACARAVTLAGLTPVFVDCDERLLMDEKLLKDNSVFRDGGVTRGPYAVMCVHVYGRRFNVESAVDRFHNCRIIEDLAEAHGVRPGNRTDAACWSFYRNKIVAGEEGGAVWFKDPAHAEHARMLRSLGFTPEHDMMHVPRGHNYRLANCLASRVLQSLRMVGYNQKVRRDIEEEYDSHCPREWRMPERDAVWVYDVRIPGMTSGIQNKLICKLKAEGIEARHAFKPMSAQEEYQMCKSISGNAGTGKIPRSWIAANEVIYLPVQPGVATEESCARAFEIIREVVG